MRLTKMYKGTLNGFKGVWCEVCPSEVIVTEEKDMIIADEGKIFQHKETGNMTPTVILTSLDETELWEEVDDPEYEAPMEM